MYKKALFCSKYINLDQPKPMQTLNFIVLDYDPFGMILSGRNWTAGSGEEYRFGFNGQEIEYQISNQDIYSFSNRIYASGLGVWLSTDKNEKKYPNLSPYSFARLNPILYKDYGGDDAVVTITNNPNGGGTIVFSSDIYVTGVQALQNVDLFNNSFITWSENGRNKGSYIDESGNTWVVEIKMNFVLDESGDISNRIDEAAGTINRSGENAIFVGDYSRSKADNKSKYSNGKFERGSSLVYFNNNDYGQVAIHEVLHLFGLIDRYTDVSYEKWYLGFRFDGTTDYASVAHSGYESNVMGGGPTLGNEPNMVLNDTQFGNLAKAALNQQSSNSGNTTESVSFVFSMDSNQVENTDSSVPSEQISDAYTLSNPKER